MLVASLVHTLAACGSDDGASDNSNGSSDDVNYSEEVEHTIIGIEPGAGITVTTEKAIEEYDSLSGWNLEASSTATMITELQEAIEAEEPIVVTGWNPHWMFAQFPDMEYLEDPKGIYGEAENIVTLARQGLESDHPEAFKLID
ncbi:ABC-type proline/glycine betaine transport system substrate-binding protein [Alkalibacillus flavidus]|uniref:ABC-type proline/glycine betaine transport system substrate-binding protein n=1 Tax=Alkalibacillus flavidus TaxID=546021 RepID=A0ABV2KY78_9BACI